MSGATGSYISGGINNDLLGGAAGNDTIDGGLGNDTIGAQGGDDSVMGGDGNDLIDGGSGADTIRGGAGNDSIQDPSGSNLILGDAGADILRGGIESDTLDGGADGDTLSGITGNDSLFGGDASDFLDGGNGNDTLLSTGGNDTMLGGVGDDSIIGFASDSIDGGTGDDTVFGGSGVETIIGGGGNDWIDFSAGNDIHTYLPDTGNDTLIGGSGSDTLYLSAGSWIQANDGIWTTYVQGATRLYVREWENVLGAISLGSLNLVGDNADNSLIGGNLDDVLAGLGGADTLVGNAGNDLLDGGEGNDSLFGGEGQDALLGGTGSDVLDGGNGNNRLEGGEGNDTLYGGAGDDTLLGGAGRDHFDGNAGNNLFNGGGGGDDYLSYNTANQGAFGVSVNLVTATASNTYGGTDTLITIRGIQGSAQSDTLIGSDQVSGALGLPGHQNSGTSFFASFGSDLINGTLPLASNSMSYAAFGVADGTISATYSNYLNAMVSKSIGGVDTLININNVFGTAGGDVLNGSPTAAPQDTFFMPISLQGLGGNDTINGFGITLNRADYSGATSAVIADLAAGSANDGQGGVDSLLNVRRILGSSFNDTITGSAGDDIIETRAPGSHRLDGGAGVNSYHFMDGADGNSPVLIDLGTTLAQGGGYVGSVVKSGGSIDTLIRFNQARGADGNDTLYGTPGDDTLSGAAGDNLFDGRGGTNAIDYGTQWYGSVPTHGVILNLGTGRATNPWDGADTIGNIQSVIGTIFSDSLTGSAIAETLLGGLGNDIIYGGGGADSLSGEAGDDVILVGGTMSGDILALFIS